LGLQGDTAKVCIIGAGSSGLAAAKTFAERGIPFDCLEREADIGGLWNETTGTGVVYDSTFLVSSRKYTGFEDFPIPEEYPTYPSHRETLAYLRAYAIHFGILDHIQLNTTVERAEKIEDGWRVQVAGEGRPRFYRALVIANGHHHEPRIPHIPGQFAGEILHSSEYRTLRQLADKRVVVVGAGNSAADIVVDAAAISRRIYLSMRRGTFFVPKFLFGRPMDGIINFIEKVPLPRWLRNRLYTHWHLLMVGKNERYGLPEPEHRIMDTHPTMNTALPQLCAHGRIGVKPEITAFDGHKVRFSDGSEVEADLVVFATGYEIAIPFLDDDMIFDAAGRPRLYLNVFHPEHDDFFAVGLIQANGSIWRLADLQSQLVASFLVAQAEGHERADWMRKLKTQGWTAFDHADYVPSARHRLEANYYDYRRALKRHLRRFGKLANRQMPPGALSTRSASAAGPAANATARRV
jgi:hypothetical protein